MAKIKPLFTGLEWQPPLIEKLWAVIDKIGKKTFKLDYFEPQFEIVTAEQMIDAYVSHGMPIYYTHWSFGKSFVKYQQAYNKGGMGLAYELVINSNPCIAYLMEDNTACMTALVMAHANCGHSHFFKNNYLFQQHTNPQAIIGFLEFAKKYISNCENEYGPDDVEEFLDIAHFLQPFGVDRYQKPIRKNKVDIAKRKQDKLQHEQDTYHHIWDTLPQEKKKTWITWGKEILGEEDQFPDENLLYIIEKNSRALEEWQRELLRIVRKLSQYFYPQYQTKIMNEGFACFIHYHIMEEMYNKGYIDEGAYLEFLQSHTSVCYQQPKTQLNPYALGFAMFMDIKRACLNPTEEDYKWVPDIAGKTDWMEEIKNIVKYYKDESFILQYLTPGVIQKFQLFAYKDDSSVNYYEITGIQSDDDIMKIRRVLSSQNELDNYRPTIVATGINEIENELHLNYIPYKGRELHEDTDIRIIEAIRRLWGGKVVVVE